MLPCRRATETYLRGRINRRNARLKPSVRQQGEKSMSKQDTLRETDELFQMIIGYRISQALHVAAKLGIADLLKDGPKSSEELATAAGVNPAALYRVLRALASVGVFAEVEHSRFTLTPLAAPLQTGVPGSLRAVAITFGEEWTWRPWGELLYSVQTGSSAFEEVFGIPLFEYFAQRPEAGRIASANFTEGTRLTAMAVANAYNFSGFHTLVDVGGNQGALIAAILKANLHLRGILFDMPHVLEGAKRFVETEGIGGRCELVAGDFFESVPSASDAYILKWILHDWDNERAVTILKNCRRAMRKEGKLLVVESVILPGNEPSYAKLSDLLMLVMAGGRERTGAEYGDLFAAAGFTLTNILPTTPTPAFNLSVIEGVCA